MNAATLARTLLSIAVTLLLAASASLAQVPKTISYQGVLTDASGTVVPDGNYNLTFRLYDVATGGTPLWAEEQLVAVSKGVFNVLLGSVAALNLPFDKPYYLGVAVGLGAELTPRIPLTSSAYSFISKSVLDGAITTAKIADQAVTQAKLAPGVSLPPGGAAGGDLTGTFPNPSIAPGAVSTAKLADNAVTSAKLADGAVATADIANAAVTKAKLSATGGTAGQVLSTDGTNLQWTTAGAGDITAVNAGPGLTGGGASGDVTLSVAVPLSLGGSASSNPIMRGTTSSVNGYGVLGSHSVSGNYGYLGSDLYGVFGSAERAANSGVHGRSEQGNGVYGYSTSGHGIHGTSGTIGYAGYFDGKVHVNGELTKSYTAGTESRATPIAYAAINADGTVASGTPNVSCSWNESLKRYEITITGENYFFNNYVTVVTPMDASRIAWTGSMMGKLLVYIQHLSGAFIQAHFGFVTYKP